ncbi:myogenesis-regulating glycosidase [Dermatophagoides farinae]|uniref:myogenesis-regulating glycosidase n=1 Tax=Dermatophagoides farinae TaxID=6954 RepID=UPI003F6306BC
MQKSRSQEELTFSQSSNTFQFPPSSDYLQLPRSPKSPKSPKSPRSPRSPTAISPPQSPKPNPSYHQPEILQLNEDSHTWKIKATKQQQNIQKSNKSLQFCFGKLQSYLKTENAFEFRFKIIVAFLFLLICCIVMMTRYFHYNLQISQALHDQILMFKSQKKITFLNDRGDNLVDLHFGLHIPNDINPFNCRSISEDDKICFDWKYRAHLSVKVSRKKFTNSFGHNETITCYNHYWRTYQKYSALKDCFDMNNGYWFGMGDIYNIQIPLNKMSVEEQPFITSHNHSAILSGSIIDRTWYSSHGVMINVPLDVPLFVSINSSEDPNRLCLISKKNFPYYMNNQNSYFAHLHYSICLAQSITTLQNYLFERNAHQQQTVTVNEKFKQQPLIKINQEQDVENFFIDHIIWSTNDNVLPNFTQQNVQSYVDQITNYGFGGIILLDSRWENSIGELRMNENVFNTPKALINILHNKGFKIMLTISPNVDLQSELVENANKYIMLDQYLQTPLMTRCTNNLKKLCALVNFTDVDNRELFRNKLNQQLLNHSTGLSVDGLYFQSIRSSLLPRYINYDHNINPDQFVEYLNRVIKSLHTSVGISTSVVSKNFTGYAQLYPRDSSWKGLQSIIPSVLSLGLIGYPLVNTGVVGGKDLFTKIKNDTGYINKELYLRWLQLVIFTPVVEFAEPPGGNDLDVIKIAKRLHKLRSEHFMPKMKSALIEHQHKGSPIVRPMWWNEKSDNESLMINDQFMVGNDIVVAPIIEEGKTERDIYLPRGWWKDEILAQVIRGGKWMRKYQVPLDKVAFFIRTEPSLTLPIQKNEITKTKTKI